MVENDNCAGHVQGDTVADQADPRLPIRMPNTCACMRSASRTNTGSRAAKAMVAKNTVQTWIRMVR